MPAKRYLLTPGPTPVPPEVLEAMARPVVHHRGPDFKRAYRQCLARLKEVCRTEHDVLLLTASGTGAFESAVANLTVPGERAIVVSSGNFGERWAATVAADDADLVHVRLPWGDAPEPGDLRPHLDGAKVVYLVHSETSTGVVADLEPLAAAAKETGALVVVDAVSSLGAVPVLADEWNLDVVVSGSQKALMTPPGLAATAVSASALQAARDSRSPRFYFDWERMRKAHSGVAPVTPFTPAISLVAGIDAALGLLLEEGLEAAFDRHVRLGRACRAGVKAMGLELFSPDEDRSAVVTAIRMPDGIDGQEIVRFLREREGVTIAGGQGHLKGNVVRIGHIGYVDVFDVTTALAGLEVALVDAGADIERGVTVTAALEAYGEPARV